MDDVAQVGKVSTEKTMLKITHKIIEGKLPIPSAPVGVFDSGVGGLSVMSEIFRQLPYEDVIYLADSARVPYGGRPAKEIVKINAEIVNYLINLGVKMIIIACGTSSAMAYPLLKDKVKIPMISMIEPGARAALNASKTKNIGVIATVGTVRSAAYEDTIRRLDKDAKVVAEPCPLFVPLIEGGFMHAEETKKVAREYLKPLQRAGIDTLILGCTHYPHISKILKEILGPEVMLVDPASAAVKEASDALKQLGLLSDTKAPNYQYLVTGSAGQFADLGSKLLGKTIMAKQIKLS